MDPSFGGGCLLKIIAFVFVDPSLGFDFCLISFIWYSFDLGPGAAGSRPAALRRAQKERVAAGVPTEAAFSSGVLGSLLGRGLLCRTFSSDVLDPSFVGQACAVRTACLFKHVYVGRLFLSSMSVLWGRFIKQNLCVLCKMLATHVGIVQTVVQT